MPISLNPATHGRLSLHEFVEFVESEIDLGSAESLSEAAEAFRALGNDPDLIATHFNVAIMRFLDGAPLTAYTPQSVFLGHGRGFFLRANLWMPLALAPTFRSHEERVFSYRNMHDHNFRFMTLGYFGPGYDTDLYRYDPSKVVGHVGERVDLEFVERTQLTEGRVMVYREKQDVHSQYPPESLSISLNVMVTERVEPDSDQYFFDAESRRIIEMPQIALIHKRASIVSLAGMMANAETAGIIGDLIGGAPCRRVREAALLAASQLRGIDADARGRLLEAGTDDRDEVVRAKARQLLESNAN